jgi:hypothetical protein
VNAVLLKKCSITLLLLLPPSCPTSIPIIYYPTTTTATTTITAITTLNAAPGGNLRVTYRMNKTLMYKGGEYLVTVGWSERGLDRGLWVREGSIWLQWGGVSEGWIGDGAVG